MIEQDESCEMPQEDSGNTLNFLEESRKLKQEQERVYRGISMKTILELAEYIDYLEDE